jgi:hypothetical protein
VAIATLLKPKLLELDAAVVVLDGAAAALLAAELALVLLDELLDPQAAVPTASTSPLSAAPNPFNLMCIPRPPPGCESAHSAPPTDK